MHAATSCSRSGFDAGAAGELGEVQRTEAASPVERVMVVQPDVVLDPHRVDVLRGVAAQGLGVVLPPAGVQRAHLDGRGRPALVRHRLPGPSGPG